jgi:hypothetical protein
MVEPAEPFTPWCRICCWRRERGLAATLTTFHSEFGKEADAALGLRPGFHSYALLPIGYPMGRFGPVRRAPLTDVVFEDRWGQPFND